MKAALPQTRIARQSMSKTGLSTVHGKPSTPKKRTNGGPGKEIARANQLHARENLRKPGKYYDSQLRHPRQVTVVHAQSLQDVGKRRITTDHRKPSTTIRHSLDKDNANQCQNNLDLSQIDDDLETVRQRHCTSRGYCPKPFQSNLNRHRCSPNTLRHQKAQPQSLSKNTPLSRIQQDDPRPWSGQRWIPQLQHLPCDPDEHVGLGALLVQHRWSTRSKKSPREGATRSRPYPQRSGNSQSSSVASGPGQVTAGQRDL